MNQKFIYTALRPFLITLTALALLTPVANAATFNVSTTPELREALITAATNGEDDTIILADGTYKTTDDALGGFNYLSSQYEQLKIVGSTPEGVVLDGDFTDRVFEFSSTVETKVIIENVTIQNGQADYGGGLYMRVGIELSNVHFTNNSSSFGGGAISFFNGHNPSRLTISNSVFTGNSSEKGGVIYLGRYTYNSFEISNSLFQNNSSSLEGGVIYDHGYYHERILYNNLFVNNTSPVGGAISSRGSPASNSYRFWAYNNTFSGNPNTIYLPLAENDLVLVNNYFSDEVSVIDGNPDAIVEVMYNFINMDKVSVTNIAENNIYEGTEPNFNLTSASDFSFDSDSDLIDKGRSTYPHPVYSIETDYFGNIRLSGASVDIGYFEFQDNDNDSIQDENDNCPNGNSDWTSNETTDHDADGCQDSLEDIDDDNDGIQDEYDSCSKGSVDWTSNTTTDNDSDGCQDSSEDTDDDNDGYLDADDAFPLNTAEWLDTDTDGTGNNADTDDDGDGMSDEYETANGLNPLVDDSTGDADQDGLNNLLESQLGSSSTSSDTDDDGLSDFDEVITHGTDPTLADSDNDGMTDDYEIAEGLNPLDGSDCPSWMCGSSKVWMLKLLQNNP